MIKVKRNDSYKQKMNRIKRLPRLKFMNSLFFSMCYGDSLRMVKAFHDGIKKNAFGLKALKDGTIRRKQRLGMELPGVPLYGEGDESENKSYINMLRLTKLKNGY